MFNGEPSTGKAEFVNKIAQHPRVYGTHHIGASTKQSESAIGDEATRIIKKFATEGVVDNANFVNKENDMSNEHKISIRHYDRVGVLAHVFGVLSKHGWNV